MMPLHCALAIVTLCLLNQGSATPPERPAATQPVTARADGYRGIWFTLGQFYEHGDKYSGGLGTYTANHVPIAVHAPEVEKTFFVYGGTTGPDERRLQSCIGYFDHASGRVARPVIVRDQSPVNDPHDNPALAIDQDGHLWVFISGRANSRKGYKYRSVRPYDIEEFELLETKTMTYPQVHTMADGNFMHLFTKYTAGRELYWQTSEDGTRWSEDQKLAGMKGHYQVSGRYGGEAGEKIGTSFMYHPDGNLDRRTNLYYVETADMGDTWTSADGRELETPLTDVHGPALVMDYEEQGLNVYIHDLNFDAHGRPVILYITSGGHEPGPENAPYTWRVTRWDGRQWQTHEVTASTANYDTGSLYVEGDLWRIIGPTEAGPQPHGTGGEIAVWTSEDEGRSWSKAHQATKASALNHSYARRPVRAKNPFYAFWADGHAGELSPSHLYFCDSTGKKVFRLPYEMEGDEMEPEAWTGEKQ